MPRKRQRRRRPKGQIIDRGDNTYLLRVYLGEDAEGRRHYQAWTVHKEREDAEAELDAAVKRVDSQSPVPSGPAVTLSQWFEHWIGTLDGISDRTRIDYRGVFARWIKPALGDYFLEQLSGAHYQHLRAELQKHQVRERKPPFKVIQTGLSTRSISYTLMILRSCLDAAVVAGRIQINPARLERRRRRSGSAAPVVRSFSEDQARAFLRAASETPLAALWWLALDTGLRPGEYLALDWPNVDLNKGTIRVQRSIAWKRRDVDEEEGDTGWYFTPSPKTDSGYRTVELLASTRGLLDQHRRRQLEQRLAKGDKWKALDLVFTNQTGGPLDMHNLSQRGFKEVLKAAGLPTTFRLYDLRHSSATLMLHSGAPLAEVARRMGHASPTITLRFYAHALPSMGSAAVRRFEDLLMDRKD